jgi:TATA element modulatory factor
MSKKGGWSSLLSGAVAGLESRLDTILADDEQASARQRAVEEEARKAKAAQRQAALKEQGVSSPSALETVANCRIQDPRDLAQEAE